MSHVMVVVDGRSTQGTVTGLEENTTYVFTVVAVNGIGRSNHSEEQWISTLSSGTFVNCLCLIVELSMGFIIFCFGYAEIQSPF